MRAAAPKSQNRTTTPGKGLALSRIARRFTICLLLAASSGAFTHVLAQARRAARPVPNTPQPTPRRVWSSVSAGATHTCALDGSGRGYCWGDNSWKRLGISDSVNQRRPVAVETPQRFRFLAAGSVETCALTAEGGTVCWGGEQPGSPPHSSFGAMRFRAMDLATNGCGVTSDNVAWCWGANGSGQLGSGRATPSRSTAPERVAGNLRWQSVVAGPNYACGIATEGVAWCWGAPGTLGNGSAQSSNVPARVSGGHAFVSLAAGAQHVCGLTGSGSTWCWGRNTYGALGNGQTQDSGEPVPVAGNQTFKRLAAGYAFTCGLNNQGQVYCWGWNQNGVLGIGTTRNAVIPTRVTPAEPFLTFTSVSAGAGHMCAIATDGSMYCWGDNADGALGIARSSSCHSGGRSRPCALVPTKVQDP